MSDLISRSALIDVLNKWADSNAMRGYDTAYDVVQDCISTVENQPTAYDVDKVVEQLEEHCFALNDYCGYVVDIEKTVEIVKAGGNE